MRPILVAFLVLTISIVGAAQRAPQPTSPSGSAGLKASTTADQASTTADQASATEDRHAAIKKAEEEAAGQFDALVRPFVTEHCIECHGYKKQKNGLNLESFETTSSLFDDHERWAEVVKVSGARVE